MSKRTRAKGRTTDAFPGAGTRRPWLLAAALVASAALLFLGYQLYSAGPREHPLLGLNDDAEVPPPPPEPVEDAARFLETLRKVRTLEAEARDRPNDGQAQAALGEEAMRAGELAVALAAYKRAIRVLGEDGALQTRAARCQLTAGLIHEAAPTFEKLIRKSPADASVYIDLALARGASNGPSAAAAVIEAGTRALSPDDHQGRAALAAAFDRMQNPARALLEVEKSLRSHPTERQLLELKAALLFQQNRIALAEAAARHLLQRHPGSGAGHRLLGSILISPLRNPAVPRIAEHHFWKALEADSRDDRALERLGRLYLDQGRLRPAAYVLAVLVEMKPHSGAARLGLAEAYHRLGMTDASVALRKSAHRWLALEREEQRRMLRRNSRPSDPALRLSLGKHLLKMRREQAALAEFHAALLLDPASRAVRDELVRLYRDLRVSPPTGVSL